MPEIVTLTLNPALDASSAVDQVVANHKLRCDRPVTEPGGGGINVSRVIRELGDDHARALWLKGGATGDALAASLDRIGLAHQPLDIQGQTRRNLTVLERHSGQQFRFTMPGPMVGDDEVRRVLDACAALDPMPGYFVVSGSIPDGVPDDVYARLARELPADCRMVVDTAGAALRGAVKGGPGLVKINLRELGELAGAEIEDDDAIDRVARGVIDEHGVGTFIVTLGAGGARWVTATDSGHVASPTVPIRSRVGAGDSMLAATALTLARGESLGVAVRFGVAAGAAAVMTPGTELCRRTDVERLAQTLAPR